MNAIIELLQNHQDVLSCLVALLAVIIGFGPLMSPVGRQRTVEYKVLSRETDGKGRPVFWVQANNDVEARQVIELRTYPGNVFWVCENHGGNKWKIYVEDYRLDGLR